MIPALLAGLIGAGLPGSAAPAIIATTGFDSTAATPTVAVTIQAGDIVLLWMSAAGNAPYNLSYTDNQGTSYAILAGILSTNTGGCFVIGKPAAGGTVTVTIPKAGGALFNGVAMVIRGVSTVTYNDGVELFNAGTTSPCTITSSTTSFATDLLLMGMCCDYSTFCTPGAVSDTLVMKRTNDTAGPQALVQSRTTSAAGAQSAFTVALTGGGSGTNLNHARSTLNLRGV